MAATRSRDARRGERCEWGVVRKRSTRSPSLARQHRTPAHAHGEASPWPDPAPDTTDRRAELRTLDRWRTPLCSVADRVALRIDEVAATTGLSKSLVRALIREGELTAVKVRTVPLVLATDLLAFLEARRSNRAEEAERIAGEFEASLRAEKE